MKKQDDRKFIEKECPWCGVVSAIKKNKKTCPNCNKKLE